MYSVYVNVIINYTFYMCVHLYLHTLANVKKIVITRVMFIQNISSLLMISIVT
jgi:hypothetical protein